MRRLRRDQMSRVLSCHCYGQQKNAGRLHLPSPSWEQITCWTTGRKNNDSTYDKIVQWPLPLKIILFPPCGCSPTYIPPDTCSVPRLCKPVIHKVILRCLQRRTVFTARSLLDGQIDVSELFMSFDWGCQCLGLPNPQMCPFLKDS